MTLRHSSPIERVAKVEDAATALHISVRQHESDAVFAGVEWLSAGLMQVQRGEKVVRTGDEPLHVRAGELVWLSPGTRVDIRSVTDEAGEYAAEGLLIAPELLVELAPPRTKATVRVRRIQPSEVPHLLEAHRRCIEALVAHMPDGVVRARVLELIAWLQELDVELGVASSARLTVKRLVSRDPARSWTLAEVAKAVAMSEDTLHRRLTGEATSFSKLLTDVRMDHAVSLLWKTDLPVGHVALEAGYTSSSRFASRFQERFGILPSKLRESR